MEEVSLLAVPENELDEILKDLLRRCEQARIAVAFFTETGFSPLKEALKDAKNCRLVIGCNFCRTQPKVLKELLASEMDFKLSHLPWKKSKQYEMFHPKMYVFKLQDRWVTIVGSSNFTGGGLKDNLEINVKIVTDEEPKDFLGSFERIWDEGMRLVDENIKEYEEHYNRHRTADKKRDEVLRETETNIKKADRKAKIKDILLRIKSEPCQEMPLSYPEWFKKTEQERARKEHREMRRYLKKIEVGQSLSEDELNELLGNLWGIRGRGEKGKQTYAENAILETGIQDVNSAIKKLLDEDKDIDERVKAFKDDMVRISDKPTKELLAIYDANYYIDNSKVRDGLRKVFGFRQETKDAVPTRYSDFNDFMNTFKKVYKKVMGGKLAKEIPYNFEVDAVFEYLHRATKGNTS